MDLGGRGIFGSWQQCLSRFCGGCPFLRILWKDCTRVEFEPKILVRYGWGLRPRELGLVTGYELLEFEADVRSAREDLTRRRIFEDQEGITIG